MKSRYPCRKSDEITHHLSTQLDKFEQSKEKKKQIQESNKKLTQLLAKDFPYLIVNIYEVTSKEDTNTETAVEGVIKLDLSNEHLIVIFIKNNEITYIIKELSSTNEKELFKENYDYDYTSIENLYVEILEINEKAKIIISQ